MIKVSSQFQRIELYPPHTSHCLYGVMLFNILIGPKCLFLLQGMKCMFIRVLPTLRWAPLYTELWWTKSGTQIGGERLWFFSQSSFISGCFFFVLCEIFACILIHALVLPGYSISTCAIISPTANSSICKCLKSQLNAPFLCERDFFFFCY